MLRPLATTAIIAVLSLTCTVAAAAEPKAGQPPKPLEKQIFDGLLEQYENETYDEFQATLEQREYLKKLSFDPTKVAFYSEMVKMMKLNAQEKEIFARNGFVSVDHDQRYSFGSARWRRSDRSRNRRRAFLCMKVRSPRSRGPFGSSHTTAFHSGIAKDAGPVLRSARFLGPAAARRRARARVGYVVSAR